MIIDEENVHLLFDKKARDEMWRRLEEYCDEHGIQKGWYCPYIPLQMCKVYK